MNGVLGTRPANPCWFLVQARSRSAPVNSPAGRKDERLGLGEHGHGQVRWQGGGSRYADQRVPSSAGIRSENESTKTMPATSSRWVWADGSDSPAVRLVTNLLQCSLRLVLQRQLDRRLPTMDIIERHGAGADCPSAAAYATLRSGTCSRSFAVRCRRTPAISASHSSRSSLSCVTFSPPHELGKSSLWVHWV
jgi:hypothetical protein